MQLQGSYDEAVYPSLSAFLHDHTLRPGGLPIPLRLASGGSLRAAHSTGYLAGGGPSHLLTGPVGDFGKFSPIMPLQLLTRLISD